MTKPEYGTTRKAINHPIFTFIMGGVLGWIGHELYVVYKFAEQGINIL